MKTGLLVNRIVVFLAVPLLAYLAISTILKATEIYQLNQQAAGIRQEIGLLKERNAELRRQMDYLQSPEYVEKVAREQLNLVQPGDIPLVVVSPSEQAPSAVMPAQPPQTRPEVLPNWQRWWNYFFGQGP